MNHLQSSPAIKNPHDRVRNHSPKLFTKAIDTQTDYVLKKTIERGPIAIRERLIELDKEWDIDRILMLTYSGAMTAQIVWSARLKKKHFFWSAFIQTSFLFFYATYGWCPPVPLLRKLGFRTRFEIQAEREELLHALIAKDWRKLDQVTGNSSSDEWDIYGSI